MTRKPLYAIEHPNYDNGVTFESLESKLESMGFTDSSWRNDSCPCLILELTQPDAQQGEQYIQIHVNYNAPELMDDPDNTDAYFLSWQGAGMNGVECESYNDIDQLMIDVHAKILKRAELMADLFRVNINLWLTHDQTFLIDHMNAASEGTQYAGCATHDYCDSNMAMAPAFESVMGYEVDPANESHCEIFNTAWDIARKRGFHLTIFDAVAMEALRSFDHNTTALVQTVIGSTDGGFAAIYWMDKESLWDLSNREQRIKLMSEYVANEITFNTQEKE